MNGRGLLKIIVRGGILASALLVIGSQWDSQVHLTVGHRFWAPSHLVIVASILLFSFCGFFGWLIHWRLGFSTGRAGLKIALIGGLTVFIGIFVFDETWHIFFGIDQTTWSPPHIFATAGMLTCLFGLAMIEKTLSTTRDAVDRIFVSWRDTDLILIFSAIYSVILFNFIEYDIPAAAETIIGLMPAFFYPVFLTAALVLTMMIGFLFCPRIGFSVLSAFLAWLYFIISGTAVEYFTDYSYMIISFPIFGPVIVFDALVWRLKRRGRISTLTLLASAGVLAAGFSFWGIIAWSLFFSQLPHQLHSSGFQQWLLWYIMFTLAWLAAYLRSRISYI